MIDPKPDKSLTMPRCKPDKILLGDALPKFHKDCDKTSGLDLFFVSNYLSIIVTVLFGKVNEKQILSAIKKHMA